MGRLPLLALVALAIAAGCNNDANVAVNVAPVTGTGAISCSGLLAEESFPCADASWSVQTDDPVDMFLAESGATSGVLLRVKAPGPTGKASACLRRFTSGFLS